MGADCNEFGDAAPEDLSQSYFIFSMKAAVLATYASPSSSESSRRFALLPPDAFVPALPDAPRSDEAEFSREASFGASSSSSEEASPASARSSSSISAIFESKLDFEVR
jgi:hypothetical protein